MDDFYGMHGPHGPHWGWGPGVFGLLAPLLFSLLWLAPLILLLWYARHAALSHVAGAAPAPLVETPSPVEALRQRYVRGEIDFDTFERMIGDLNAGSHAAPPVLDAMDDAEGATEEEQAPPQFRPRSDIPIDWS
jgi:uncharacterized membrane protein